jgi:hypothetical protein
LAVDRATVKWERRERYAVESKMTASQQTALSLPGAKLSLQRSA